MNVNYKVGDRFILEIAGGNSKYGFSIKDGNGEEIHGLIISEDILRRLPQDIPCTTVEYHQYRSWAQLLASDLDDLKQDERVRLTRIKAMPEVARNVLLKRCDELRESIMELESEYDALIDYINGERGAE